MIRIILALVSVAIALGGLSIGKTQEEGRLRETIAGHVACDFALTGSDLTASAVRCPGPTATAHAASVRTEACDAALLSLDLFALRTSCSTEVKTLFASREAESRRADQLAEILDQERAGRAAAITRADARARTETERTMRAQSALQGAPRRGDLLVLDAERLRQLGAGDAPAERP